MYLFHVWCYVFEIACTWDTAGQLRPGANALARSHDTGVDVPEDCWMRVGEDKRVWENGKALVLDTSFEHETFNKSRRDRIVLIIDFWHPGQWDLIRPRDNVTVTRKRLLEVHFPPWVIEVDAGES